MKNGLDHFFTILCLVACLIVQLNIPFSILDDIVVSVSLSDCSRSAPIRFCTSARNCSGYAIVSMVDIRRASERARVNNGITYITIVFFIQFSGRPNARFGPNSRI